MPPDKIYSKYSGAVVFITSYSGSGNILGYGSGVLVSSDGTIYTCLHVNENGVKFDVCVNKKVITDVTVIGFDPFTDAAILKIPQCFDSEPAAIASEFSAPGELVYALGNPQGLKNTFSSGIISRLDSNSTSIRIQFSASISPGSSGGALFNSKGELIGLPSSYYTTGQNLNFAIPVSEFKIIPKIDPANPDQFNIIRSIINRHTGNND